MLIKCTVLFKFFSDVTNNAGTVMFLSKGIYELLLVIKFHVKMLKECRKGDSSSTQILEMPLLLHDQQRRFTFEELQ